jgi:predicted nucleic acid-binding protein
MATSPPSNPLAVVIDANVLIAICARETGTYPVASAQMRLYETAGSTLYAPGVLIAETLFGLCRQLQNGIMTAVQHRQTISRLIAGMQSIHPPPTGDASLVLRAEQIRGSYGCSRSADGLDIALAEQLGQSRLTELVTFDAQMQAQSAVAAPGVMVRLLLPGP